MANKFLSKSTGTGLLKKNYVGGRPMSQLAAALQRRRRKRKKKRMGGVMDKVKESNMGFKV